MPRPNKPRQVPYEAHLAERIKLERDRLDLTYERLAERMTDAGCPMAGSAIFKIENGDPPRRITLNEAVTFALVFDIKLSELMAPPALVAHKQVLAAYENWRDLIAERAKLIQNMDDRLLKATARIQRALARHPLAEESLHGALLADFGPDSHWTADLLEDLRG